MAESKALEYLGTGRRKTSIARVRLMSGTGKITVNGRTFENYFPMESLRGQASQPLAVTGMSDKFDARINVRGGGPRGQDGAVRNGIGRGLLVEDGHLRQCLTAVGV